MPVGFFFQRQEESLFRKNITLEINVNVLFNKLPKLLSPASLPFLALIMVDSEHGSLFGSPPFNTEESKTEKT